MDYQGIGQRIRAMRRKQNLSQEQLAEKVWISTTHMSHIETASTKLSLPVLVDIANALNASVDEILFGATSDNISGAQNEMLELLHSCKPEQAKLLVEIMKRVKSYLDIANNM